MIWSVVAYSMHFGFNSISVRCSAISIVSSNGGKYGWRCFTLNTRCRTRNGVNLSSKELSPTTLVMVYDPYQSGRSLRWGPTRHSLCKCSQTLSPTWNLCNTWYWSWHCLYLALDLSNISWTYWQMCRMCLMKLLALLALDWTWAKSTWVATNGMATSMGHND